MEVYRKFLYIVHCIQQMRILTCPGSHEIGFPKNCLEVTRTEHMTASRTEPYLGITRLNIV